MVGVGREIQGFEDLVEELHRLRGAVMVAAVGGLWTAWPGWWGRMSGVLRCFVHRKTSSSYLFTVFQILNSFFV